MRRGVPGGETGRREELSGAGDHRRASLGARMFWCAQGPLLGSLQYEHTDIRSFISFAPGVLYPLITRMFYRPAKPVNIIVNLVSLLIIFTAKITPILLKRSLDQQQKTLQ